VLTLILEELGLFLLVDFADFSSKSITVMNITIDGELIAKLIVGVVVVIINYIFSKMFIFKKRKS
jgi:putative flippase GtrA